MELFVFSVNYYPFVGLTPMHLHQQLPEFFQLQLRILDCTADLRRHLKDHLFSYNALRKKYFFGFFPSDKPSQEYCNERK
jgi:hypothetical protein